MPAIYAGLVTLQRFYGTGSAPYLKLKKEYIKTLNIIECFHFVNNEICTQPTNKVEPMYAKAAKQLYSAKTTVEAVSALRELQSGLKGNDGGLASEHAFIAAFRDLTYTPSENKPQIAYIFDRLNSNPFEGPGIPIYDPQQETIINRLYEIEHIAPISTWQGEEEILNNVGNLLILTKQTNRDVDNKALPEKVRIYEEKRFDSMVPVRDFVDFVREEKIDSMTPEVITSRAILLAERAYRKTWNPWQT